MAKKNYDIVKVTWVDAEEYGDTGWNTLKEQLAHAKKPCPEMVSIGFLVHHSKEHVALLSTIGKKDCSTLEKIPAGFIVKIETLGISKKKDPTVSSKK